MDETRGGFTLVELLAAMALSAVVTAAVFQLLGGLGRFAEGQNDLLEARQNATAALELMATELRSTVPEIGFVRASSDSVTFRSARLSGVLCETSGSESLNLVVWGHGAASVAVNSGTAIAVRRRAEDSSTWSVFPVTSMGGSSGRCGDNELPVGMEARSFAITGSIEGLEPGDVAYVYELITYRRGRSAGVAGEWIQRRVGNGAGSSNQPMAGPVDGLRFGYSAAGSATFAGAVGDAEDRSAIGRVIVIIEATARAGHASSRRSVTDSTLVALRNR